MKKLYRKGQVHPSPTPTTQTTTPTTQTTTQTSHEQFCLNYLPAAILTLAASLSFEDKQVLSYLLSCSSNTPFDFNPSKSSSKKHPQNLTNINNISTNNNNNTNTNNNQHPPSFSCYCFTCYTSYWARWDSSPNRQLIHEIIDAFEDNLLAQRKKKQGLSRKEKRKNNNNKSNIIINNSNNKGPNFDNDYDGNMNVSVNHLNVDPNGSNGSGRVSPDSGRVDPVEEEEDGGDETGEKQGSVRKIVSFIGEKLWGSVWG